MSAEWNHPGWDERAQAWIEQRLAERGIALDSPIEMRHKHPWSALMQACTPAGMLYFKASAPYLTHEPALMQWLYARRPDCMVQVLAADIPARWLLMADEGRRLRDLASEPDYLPRWQQLLPRFAELQIELAPHALEMLDLGVMDRRLAHLPGMFQALLADEAALGVGQDDGLTFEQAVRLRSLGPAYAKMCARLAEFPVPETLHHDDLHDANVYVNDERTVFADWAESCLTHPFFSVIITLRSISDYLGLPEEATASPERLAPQIERLRDAYLEPWTRFAPMRELRAIFPTAWRAGMVNRALTWNLVLHNLEKATRHEYAYTVPAWLGEFLLAL